MTKFKSKEPVIPLCRESELWDITCVLLALLCNVHLRVLKATSVRLADFTDEEAEPREMNVSKFPNHCPPSPSPFPLQLG